MAQRRVHYEAAFEHYLRANRVPYVAVDEAKKTLLPTEAANRCGLQALKSFDFVIHQPEGNLLVDIKGRRHRGSGRRLDNWVTLDDIECLTYWSGLFGAAYEPTLVFMYWCTEQPPDGLFVEVFEHQDRWYALRSMSVETYRQWMVARSPRWRTVTVPTRTFERLAEPFSVRTRPQAV